MRRFLGQRKYDLTKAACLVAAVVVFAAFGTWASAAQAQREEVAAQIAAAERAASRGPYALDGTFTGSARGYGGPIKMQVTVDNGYIDAVVVLDASHEDDAWLQMTAGLPDKILKAQGTDVDVVSGATYTSAGMLNGVSEALRQALGDEQR